MIDNPDHWLDLTDLVRRYLRAYGPASILDMQSWSGMSKLTPYFKALDDELVTFRAEDGRTGRKSMRICAVGSADRPRA